MKILDAGMKDIGASSCTFYVQDPWWPDQLFLVFMPGVKISEPMHGFVLPSSSYMRVAGHDGSQEKYFTDAAQDDELRDQMFLPLNQLAAHNYLFGDFVHREQVKSCARLRRFSPEGKVKAVLWVNFNEQKKTFERRKIRKLMDDLVKCLPSITQKLRRENPFPISQLVQILKPAEQLATLGHPLEWYLNSILDAVLQAFNIDEEIGLGTIYSFDPKAQKLQMVAHKGKMNRNAMREHNVRQGEGIISWVAAKRRALLINDLSTSQFKDIYKRIANNIVSELAVPMLAGDELLGVINLETRTRPSPLSIQSVRTIWYAANQAAIACRLSQQAFIAKEQTERTSQLLEIAHDAPLPARNSRPLAKLAILARDWLQATECDIWQYSEEGSRFTDSGLSYDASSFTLPRKKGWSDYIRRTKMSVWIFGVADRKNFKCKFWDSENLRWKPSASMNDYPEDVNQRLIDLNIRCELGMPIMVGDKCVGVTWLKYTEEKASGPTAAKMHLAGGFAAQVGLVIDVLQRHKESHQKEEALKEYRDSIFGTGMLDFPGVQGFVIRRPCGDVGGDFHAAVEIDDTRTSFLVGDAEGHGILGALKMLPMITNFRLFSKESCSTKHILWKLFPICDHWTLRGTAICFIIDVSGSGKPLIFASSAGHPSLIIFRASAQNFDFPDSEGVANRGQLGVGLNLPIGEEVYELSSGDLVIAYTDGVLKPHKNHPKLGRTGIIEAIVPRFTDTPETIAKAIEEKALLHTDGQMDDDATIMVLRVK
jgi:serine phosphatase RsbU (regulator of sigma subunit)/putative methionine-R-sulfoxide reductase with GAF domain